MEDVQVKAFLYRWTQRTTAEGEEIPYSIKELTLTPAAPTLRSGLWGHSVCREGLTASDGMPRSWEGVVASDGISRIWQGVAASGSIVRVVCEQQ